MRACSPLTSLRDCVIGLPISPLRVAARSSMRSCASFPKRARAALRSSMRTRAHCFWPRSARANLRATDSAESSATSRMTAPVAGFTTERRAPRGQGRLRRRCSYERLFVDLLEVLLGARARIVRVAGILEGELRQLGQRFPRHLGAREAGGNPDLLLQLAQPAEERFARVLLEADGHGHAR